MASLCGDATQGECTAAWVFLLYLVVPVVVYLVGVLLVKLYRLTARKPTGEERAEERSA